METTSTREKIATILRVDQHVIEEVEKRLSSVTGKAKVLEAIITENEDLIISQLLALGVSRSSRASEVFDALISKVESDDYQIYKALGNPDCKKIGDCQRISDTALNIAKPPKGFFLKLDKAREFLLKEPPRQVMAFLGYSSVEEMLEKEDLMEVYSSLRFIEGNDWLNNVFFKQYEKLTPEDFEERDIVVKALSEKWGVESEKFVKKKHHNISHLKELGVVFVIPTLIGISGEILRMFALIFHYLSEIPFYASIFKTISKDRATFSNNFISLLRGDVLEEAPEVAGKSVWLVIQRYLAKDDPNDHRLFIPHINPEALHWTLAIERLFSVGEVLDGFSEELSFWRGSGWIGDYFRDEAGVDVLISFDLVDTVMDLVKRREGRKYLYHHQEALWNKIFSSYFGGDELEKYCRDYLLKGYFEL